jgi:hypothetical protein
MKNLIFSVSFLLTIMFYPPLTTRATVCSCNESGLPPCAAYWRADAVFVGSVTEILPASKKASNSLPEAILRFSIEEAFRGINASTVIEVATLSGTSCDSHFSIGENYLVYAHRDSTSGQLDIWPCDRTKSLSRADEDLAYIRGLSRDAPEQSILGRVSDGKYDPLKDIKIRVQGIGKEYGAMTDKEGNYKVVVERPGAYRVQAFIPFSAVAVNRPDFRGEPTEKQTVVEYELNIPLGQCDYREIQLYKVDLRARAEISGKVVDIEGKPERDLTLYLYPATDQSFSSDDYEIATTDTEGNYSFKGLKAGRYRLGVNIGRMPDVSAPYPETFYPGVPQPERATILSLVEGQKLTNRNIQLPPKLVEREITGVIVWPDGNPAEKSSRGAVPNIGLVFSVQDPQLGVTLTPFRRDRTVTQKVEDGRFSFIGFEGYSYVIHVHAFDSEGRVMHAKHIKVRLEGEIKPIKLVLSLPGYGTKEEEIKKELGEQK